MQSLSLPQEPLHAVAPQTYGLHGIGAGAVHALVRGAADQAVGLLRHALAGAVAVVAGNAVAVASTGKLAGRGAANIWIALRRRRRRARAAAAARRRGGGAAAAGSSAALRGGIGAAHHVAAIAASAAGAAVARAGGTSAVRHATDRHALAHAAGHVARLALPVAGLIAANAVGAGVVHALVRATAGQAVGLLRHALAGAVAVVA